MAYGKIQAIGEALTLKKTFGAGYKISIIVEPTKIDRIKAAVESIVEGAIMEDDAAGALLYCFPNSSLVHVGNLVEYLNSVAFVKSWGLSQTTLEQVFLSVVRAAQQQPQSVTNATKIDY